MAAATKASRATPSVCGLSICGASGSTHGGNANNCIHAAARNTAPAAHPPTAPPPRRRAAAPISPTATATSRPPSSRNPSGPATRYAANPATCESHAKSTNRASESGISGSVAGSDPRSRRNRP